MSDVMLLGVLRLPLECWTDDQLFKMQQQSRCVEAADRIEADADRIERLQSQVAELRGALHKLSAVMEHGVCLNEDGSPRSEWDFDAIAEIREARKVLEEGQHG